LTLASGFALFSDPPGPRGRMRAVHDFVPTDEDPPPLALLDPARLEAGLLGMEGTGGCRGSGRQAELARISS